MSVGEHAVGEEKGGSVVGVGRVGQLREEHRNGVVAGAGGYYGSGSWGTGGKQGVN